MPSGPAIVSANLQGYFEQAPGFVNQHVRMYVNGLPVAEGSFAGFNHYVLSGAATNVAAGTNTVTLSFLKDAGVYISEVLIESFDVSYPRRLEAAGNELTFIPGEPSAVSVRNFSSPDVRAFDVNAPLRPVWISGAAVDSPSGGLYRIAFDAAPATNRFLAVAGVRTPAFMDGVTPADLLSTTNRADI